MDQVELILNYILELFQTPLFVVGGVTLTGGSIIVMLFKFFFPKNKQLKASEIIIDNQRIENQNLEMRNKLLEEQNSILREENAMYKECINTIAKNSRNRDIQALAIEEQPVQQETEVIRVKVVD